jgi:hypothetical protein
VKPRIITALAVATALTLVSTACSGGATPAAGPRTETPSASASGPPNPCQLLTADDLKAATGLTFQQRADSPKSEPDPPGYQVCHFDETDDTDGLPAAAWLAMYPTNRAEFDTGRDALMQLPLDLADIDGVGETAYGKAGEIRVFQDSWYLEVQVEFVDLDGTEAITSLAKTVLSRLA